MPPRVDRHRLTFVLLASLGRATVCFAQDVARMDQVVQSHVSNGTFAGSVLVARGSDVIVSKGYGLPNVEWNNPNSPSARFRVASIYATRDERLRPRQSRHDRASCRVVHRDA
jgi:CubicO group peptidase (beta-lactamase class C family)